MKKLLLAALIGILVNCSITQKPQVEKVKKMAIVSIYANKDFYDIDSPPAEDMDGVSLIAGTDKLLGLDTAPNSPEILGTLMLSAQASFEKELGRVTQWQIVPHDQVRSNPALKSFQLSLGKEQSAMLNSMNEKLAKSTAGTVSLDLPYLVTPGLVMVPTDKIETHVIGGKSPTEDLAELAKSLNVDAVLVIELDIAYDLGGAFSLFKDEVTISSAIYGVDTQGEFVIKSQPVKPGSGKRFTGDEKVKHVKGFSMNVSKLGGDVNVPILSENNAIVQYNKAIKKNAQYFADEIISELE